MMFKRFADGLEPLRAQLAASLFLRLGLILIAATLWSYGLMLGADLLTDRQKQLALLSQQAASLSAVAREQQWSVRADEVERQLIALQAMVWVESDLGLAEARFQDWVRATASSTGLALRDLNLVRVSATPNVPKSASAASAGRPAAETQVITARLTADLNREALLAFLSEVSLHHPAVMVDRLMVRTGTEPSSAEIDLRILARAGVSK
jgi:hypothetical protein